MQYKRPPVKNERRLAPRRACNLAGRICIPGYPPVDCTVRDISPMGAMVELATPAVLPISFRLLIPQDRFSADCERRYQSGSMSGVLFLSNRRESTSNYGSADDT